MVGGGGLNPVHVCLCVRESLCVCLCVLCLYVVWCCVGDGGAVFISGITAGHQTR